MGVIYTPESEYAKEMRKHEAHHTQYGPPGRSYVYADYPSRLYRAGRGKSGKIEILEGQTVHNDDERRSLESRGFIWGGQADAIAAYETTEFTHAELAAERNFHERRMSPQAQREAAAANAEAGAKHLPEVPELPVPAHRKRKNAKRKNAKPIKH